MQANARPRVVVVGAGFGGLQVVRKLARQSVSVTVIDRKNHHTFQPLLYQVATAGLSPAEIAAPIRWILRGDAVEVLLGDVDDVRLADRRVVAGSFEVPYDYLVLAAGASHAYFGHWISQPRSRDVPVGVVLLHLRAGGSPDYREYRAARLADGEPVGAIFGLDEDGERISPSGNLGLGLAQLTEMLLQLFLQIAGTAHVG